MRVKKYLHSYGMSIGTGLLRSARNDGFGWFAAATFSFLPPSPDASLRGAQRESNPVLKTHFEEMQPFLNLSSLGYKRFSNA